MYSYSINRIVAILLICFAWLGGVSGQKIVLTDVSPRAGALDIQRLTMVNLTGVGIPAGEQVKGILQAALLDANLNTIVVIKSQPVFIAQGQQISSFDVPWSGRVEYGNGQSARTLQSTGKLFQGDYLLCHSFQEITGGAATQEIGKNCQEIKAELDVTFRLLYPANQSVIPESRPNLIWEAVARFGLMTNDISYDLKLVEVRPNQTLAAAIATNPTLINRRGLQQNTLLYPLESPLLQPGKRYGWQVAVVRQGTELLISQPWSFP